jgi:membrane protein required for colicin V production
MLDFVLGLALAAMLVRGWARGFVREALDLVGLIVGIWIAFRLSGPVGDFLTDSFGVGPELARIGSGVVLFVLFGASLSIAAHYLTKMMNLPGLSMVNRVGGAAVAVIWGVALVLVVLTLLSLMRLPDSWRDQIDDSRVAQAIIGEQALPRQTFESLAGDNVMAAMAALQNLFGSSRVVPEGDEVVQIPPAAGDEVRQVRDEADDLVQRINEYRVGMGLSAVQATQAIIDLAETHAVDRYTTGRLVRLQACRSTLADRSYQVVNCDNAIALAGTAVAGLQGILDTTGGEATLGDPRFDRAGVSVVEGPTGRLVVVILGG